MSGHNDDSDDEREQETWFAGGERSGISVQNPNAGRSTAGPGGDLVRDLLRRAEEEGAAAPPSGSGGRAGGGAVWGGGGHVLGGEGRASAFVPAAGGEAQDDPADLAIRRLTFWRQGFTVEDGPLMRYDDPQHADVLAAIHSGHAPPSILNVRPGQRVDVQVTKRTDDDWVPPKPKPFSGAGNRLGAPVPGSSTAPASSSTSGGGASGVGSAGIGREGGGREGSSSITPRFEVDSTQPTTSVQVRLADGTRIVCRMNLTHTVQDLRNFINAARPENLTRPYTIGTTFPNRVLSDMSATIEGEGLKGCVVVQRWV
ncbi:SEP-domain-containing protein [Mycena polygramma]|nr:SEP-domain-containing protein [Mycena polygramma]